MEELVRAGKALSDPLRLQILHLLARGRDQLGCCVSPDESVGLCVCDLQEALGMGQSKVSYHMKELKAANLVTETQRGKWTYYSINRNGFEALLGELRQQFLAETRPLIRVE
jgi:ArsR family transcriptional regulator, arsenate/arsenite/antimonite-responsive transcriptional repressor